MNDIPRSRRPATRSPRGSRQSDQLGELEFSDWYEIPVFEPDEDELTEEIATGGHGPRRLMARAKLARDARRAKRRPEWDAPVRRPAAPAAAPAGETPARTEHAPAATAPEVTAPAATAPAAIEPAAAEPTRQIAPEPATVAAAKQAPAPAEKPEPAKKPARAKKPEPARVPAMAQVRDEDTWVTSGPALTEESMRLDLERDSVWRRRLNDFLDRWAAKEVAAQHRLDTSIEHFIDRNLPKSIPDLLAAATKRGGSR